jgi:hypothetical protein
MREEAATVDALTVVLNRIERLIRREEETNALQQGLGDTPKAPADTIDIFRTRTPRAGKICP